ncbi:MAG: hypothetical protein WCB49_07105 [Gammaproteobacteria bacterium]
MSERNYNWDAIAAIIAALIGLLAIFISGYTAWNVRQQTRAQVWPYLELGESDSLPTDQVNGQSHGGLLVAMNQGVGPAHVRSLEVLVDGKPQPDWNHVFAALGVEPGSFSTSTFNHTVLSPGEKLDYLVIIGHKDWLRFKSKLGGDIVVRACYCSTLGDCWTSALNYRKTLHQGQPVDSCSRVPNAEQFRN